MSDQVTAELLDQLVRRIVEIVHPRRIILFGSAAKGQMGPNSDLDILVVMRDGIHRRQTVQTLYRHLPASLVLYPALREGKELYVAGE